MALSENAQKALTSAKNHHQGTEVPKMGLYVDLELEAAGLISKYGNLTRKGSIMAERLKNAEMDRLFPL